MKTSLSKITCLIVALILCSSNCFAVAAINKTFSSESLASQKQKQIMQDFTNYILQHKQSPWGVSAFSMVAQCKQHQPIIVYGGTYTKNTRRPITKNSIFQIGSITKSFVSVIILQLVETHKLSLDDPIGKYFPNYPKWAKITVKQLLNMTSGIPDTDGGSNNIFEKFTANEYQGYLSPTQILDLVYKLPMNFKPGKKYEYSNPNYMLLGLLIKKITHHSAAYEINKRIIHKLHLLHTYYVKNTMQTVPGIQIKKVVHGYSYWPRNTGYTPYAFQKFGEDTFQHSLSHYNYAGAIISTPTDINRYIHALFTPGVLLSSTSLKLFTTLISTKNGQYYSPEKNPNVMGYGLGVLGLFSAKLKTMLYFYQGQTNGYSFVYIYSPQTKQYLTFAINTISNIINKKNSFELFYTLNALCKNNG